MFAVNALPWVLLPARRVTRLSWRNGVALLGERTLAEEVPVAFSYDGTTHAVLIATPDDLDDHRQATSSSTTTTAASSTFRIWRGGWPPPMRS